MEYKSFSKILKKKEKKIDFKKIFTRFLVKTSISVILFLIALIYIKYDKNNGDKIYNFLYSKNITMASVNNLYSKYFGDILPFQSSKNVEKVFNETIKYKDISKYKDGFKLSVDNNYLIPIVNSGVVVFVGEKEEYGKTVIIEQVDGVRMWYANIDNLNINIYDYVKKGEYLASSKGNYFYLVLEKQGSYLDLEKYLNEN